MIDAHPLAELIPSMSESEFAELSADIAANGLHEPIVLYEGLVLDGRHRLRACGGRGIEPRFTTYEGDAPAAFVLSMNIARRHLSSSQRSAVAVEFLPALEAEAKRRQGAHLRSADRDEAGRAKSAPFGADLEPHRAADDAAAAVGASPRSVQRAKRVKDADHILHEQVKAGPLTVAQAEQRVENLDLVRGDDEAEQAARDGLSRDELLSMAAERGDERAKQAQIELRDKRLTLAVFRSVNELDVVVMAQENTVAAIKRLERRDLERMAERCGHAIDLLTTFQAAAQDQLGAPLRSVS